MRTHLWPLLLSTTSLLLDPPQISLRVCVVSSLPTNARSRCISVSFTASCSISFAVSTSPARELMVAVMHKEINVFICSHSLHDSYPWMITIIIIKYLYSARSIKSYSRALYKHTCPDTVRWNWPWKHDTLKHNLSMLEETWLAA